MQADRFTLKSQEALSRRRALASDAQETPRVFPSTSSPRCSSRTTRSSMAFCGRSAPSRRAPQRGHRRARRPGDAQGRGPGAGHERRPAQRAPSGRQVRPRARRPVRLHRAPAPGAREPQRQVGRHPEERRRDTDNLRTAISEVRKGKAVTDQSPEQGMRGAESASASISPSARSGANSIPSSGVTRRSARDPGALSRRTKNNPVLIGEPASGKTAIAEGLAQRIVSGDVRRAEGPPRGDGRHRRDARRREVPRRVRGAPQGRAQRGEGGGRQIVLFIDELHTIVGRARPRARWMPRTSSSRCSLAVRLRAVGATTLDEYRQHIREGPCARAPVPAGDGRRAVGGGHDRDPPRPEGALRGAPWRAHPGTAR